MIIPPLQKQDNALLLVVKHTILTLPSIFVILAIHCVYIVMNPLLKIVHSV